MDATRASWPPLPGEPAQTPDLLVERIVILQKGWNSGTQRQKGCLKIPLKEPCLMS